MPPVRNPHYWRKAGRATSPSNIIVVDTEAWHGKRVLVPGGERHILRLGNAIGYHLRKGKRTRQASLDFVSSDQFWDFVRTRFVKGQAIWIFAHNAHYDLGILNAWRVILSGNFEAEKIAVNNTMLWIRGSWHGQTINYCDTVNYYHCSLSAVGSAVGTQKLPMPSQDECDSIWKTYCQNDVDIAAKGIDRIIEFVKRHELGPWKPTIAGLAFSAYRSRFMKYKVLVHSNAAILEMERKAYCGGAVDTYFIGRVPDSPVYELDVVSMYASQCMKDLPAVHVPMHHIPTTRELLSLADEFMLCADVEIETADYRYPFKTPDGTIYPIGRYRTCLAHPELMEALRRCHVKNVYKASRYTKKPLFKEYMQYFARLKSEYHNAENAAFETVSKYFQTNLYGKTGQTSPVWKEWGEKSLQEIEESNGLPKGTLEPYYTKPPDLYQLEQEHIFTWIDPPAKKGTAIPPRKIGLPTKPRKVVVSVRNYFGQVEVQTTTVESWESCPIIAATVTSYARVFLRYCQCVAGVGNHFYGDTDSIWTNRDGYKRLTDSGLVDREVIGKLALERVHKYMVIYGPKDYETDYVTKLKGIRLYASDDVYGDDVAIPVRHKGKTLYLHRSPDGGFRQLQFPTATQQLRRGDFGAVFVRHVIKHLNREIRACRVGSDGWTTPLVLPEDLR
jgi:DNA polymerase type B, organellar and viral